MLLEPVFSFINDHRERFVEELAQFLSIPSVSTLSDHRKDVLNAAEWVLDQLKRCGFRRQNLSYRASSDTAWTFARSLRRTCSAHLWPL